MGSILSCVSPFHTRPVSHPATSNPGRSGCACFQDLELGFLPFLPISVPLISGCQADLRLGTLGIQGSVPGPTGSYLLPLASRRQAEKLGLLELLKVQQLP